MSKGVIKGASIVETGVMVIDKARFTFAKYEITLYAIPFGAQPIRIIPATISVYLADLGVTIRRFKLLRVGAASMWEDVD